MTAVPSILRNVDTTLLASVAAPLVGWLIVGGAEKRREEQTLWMLEVADRLGPLSTAAQDARKVAEKELSRILERWRTRLWQNLWLACGLGASVAAIVLFAGAFVGRDVVMRVGSAVVGVMYIGMAAWAFRHLREVWRVRRKQRPTNVVLPTGTDRR